MTERIVNPGPKPVVKGKKAVCSSAHPIVTETMKNIMLDGGNAIDAGIAGCLVQAAVQPHMTNHTGTVAMLYFEAETGKCYQLESSGTLVAGLPPFYPFPPNLGGLASSELGPAACIPGFMPGLNAMYQRFATKPWSQLCQSAIHWAKEGHTVSSFEYGILEFELPSNTYFPSGRELFIPNGFTPPVGTKFKNPKLAETLTRLSQEGPDYFTTGDWARHFVEEANRLGWKISIEHMTENPPRWLEPLRYKHREYEILQLSPPQDVGMLSVMALGILDHLHITSCGHYSESAESLYYMAHVLRWVNWEIGMLNDPSIFEVPVDQWLSSEHHAMIANIIKNSRPRVDLSEHVHLTSGKPALAASGLPTAGPSEEPFPSGSCELSIVDADGNWVQMMNTLQSGGIPGLVVDGVPMVGSHCLPNRLGRYSGWIVKGSKVSLALGNTIVLKDNEPYLSLGTPGNVHITIPQVLSNILDFGMDPYEACCQPRMVELRDNYVLEIENRIPESVITDLVKMGISIKPGPMYDSHMGSYQICWRDEETGLMNSCADPRRAGIADGF